MPPPASRSMVLEFSPDSAESRDTDLLTAFLERTGRLFVLTGAGCSTESGIPDYRDADGSWKRQQPIQWREFAGSAAVRRRYWARGSVGWRKFTAARPNPAHDALARLERDGPLHWLVTQNVDGLHQRAGSRRVVDLHGRLDQVSCLECDHTESRDAFQRRLETANTDWRPPETRAAPDGDAELGDADYDAFAVPPCPACGGVMRPDFVFFGETVPKPRVTEALARLEEADGVLVVGSSLMVWSGFRFVRRALERELPVAVVNLGATRAGDDVTLHLHRRAGELLPRVVERLRR